MDNIKDITKILEKAKEEDKTPDAPKQQTATNPIFKKLVQFANTKLSKKFDINDLLR